MSSLIKVDQNGNVIPLGLNSTPQALFPAPDYSNMETVNRISVNNGTWLADRNGYVLCKATDTNTNTYYMYFHVFVNGKEMTNLSNTTNNTDGGNLNGSSSPQSVVLPVSKGDVIRVMVDAADTSSFFVFCFYIPIKWSKQAIAPSLYEANKYLTMGPPDYSTLVEVVNNNDTTVSWTAGRDGYVKSFVNISSENGGNFIQVRLNINNIYNDNIVEYSSDGQFTLNSSLYFVKAGDVITNVIYTDKTIDNNIIAFMAPMVTPPVLLEKTPVINYSLVEQDTGRKWIDGKPIYVKTLPQMELTILPTGTTIGYVNDIIPGATRIVKHELNTLISSVNSTTCYIVSNEVEVTNFVDFHNDTFIFTLYYVK